MSAERCTCLECQRIAAAGSKTVVLHVPPAPLEEQLHATRNELTKARLALDLVAQRLGVTIGDYERVLDAVQELRMRCGEVETP